jgi:hypothetical protein
MADHGTDKPAEPWTLVIAGMVVVAGVTTGFLAEPFRSFLGRIIASMISTSSPSAFVHSLFALVHSLLALVHSLSALVHSAFVHPSPGHIAALIGIFWIPFLLLLNGVSLIIDVIDVSIRGLKAADAAWTPVDAILKSRTLSNLFVLTPPTAAGCLVLRREGTLGVVNSAGNIGAIAAALYALIRAGRRWRNVKPPEAKARHVKK